MSGSPASGRVCAFCGASGALTREHVFGRWLSKFDEGGPHLVSSGFLNELPTTRGPVKAFDATVKRVCASCNNGWMSAVESGGAAALSPLLAGTSDVLEPEDALALAVWLQKTALVSLLAGSAADRAENYGLPPQEYRDFYERDNAMAPLGETQSWAGVRSSDQADSTGLWVVPILCEGPLGNEPAGYVITLMLDRLVLQQFRSWGAAKVAVPPTFAQTWPIVARTRIDRDVSDVDFIRYAFGRELTAEVPGPRLYPSAIAVDVPTSEQFGFAIEMPAVCGRHVVLYPAALVGEARRGRFYWFITSCECQIAYLVRTEADGAHTRGVGEPPEILAQWSQLVGEELLLRDPMGEFVVRRAQ